MTKKTTKRAHRVHVIQKDGRVWDGGMDNGTTITFNNMGIHHRGGYMDRATILALGATIKRGWRTIPSFGE